MSVTLTEAIVAIHLALDQAELPHAFGGALALAWCTEEPRATIDIDLNVLVEPSNAPRVLAALPSGISHDATTLARLVRDGQERLWWGRIAVDLFFSNTEYHDLVAEGVQRHPFAGYSMPFLSCQSLATFKVFSSRSKDWVDLESMAVVGRVDLSGLRDDLVGLLGSGDRRIEKLDAFIVEADRLKGQNP